MAHNHAIDHGFIEAELQHQPADHGKNAEALILAACIVECDYQFAAERALARTVCVKG